MNIRATLLVLATFVLTFSTCESGELPIAERIDRLAPIIGGYPPSIEDEAQQKKVESEYIRLKDELDAQLKKSPKNAELLYQRGRLQSMGHNFDHPGAWQGATDDLRASLEIDPNHIPAVIELASLWVNSNPNLAGNAEELFRGAQCLNGKEPLEEAQRGIFFALYYQGKLEESARQAAYLIEQWPTSDAYKRLKATVDDVMARKGVKLAVTNSSPTMASCNMG